MDILEKEAWPGRREIKRGPHPFILRALSAVIDGQVVKFDEKDLKVVGLKNMLALEQSLRRQAKYLEMKISVSNQVNKSTGEKEIWVRQHLNGSSPS